MAGANVNPPKSWKPRTTTSLVTSQAASKVRPLCLLSDYSLAHKACLNFLPGRTVQKRINAASCTTTTCRTCHSIPETLGHVLNHCFIRQRHNDFLIKAIGPTLASASGPSSPNLSPSDAKFQWRRLEQHFTTNYQPPDITIDSPTEWLHQNSNTADIMEDLIVPEEVAKASAT